MTKITAAFELITPELATELLRGNVRNRTLLRSHVQRLAEAMSRGEWMRNGEPIQIAADGTILNGQHRLSAIEHSGEAIELLVMRGVPGEGQHSIDLGARRQLADVLALKGWRETPLLAAVVGLIHRYRIGARMDGSGRTAPTAPEALALLEREPSIPRRLQLARRVNAEAKMSGRVAGALLHLFEEIDEGNGRAFFETLAGPDVLESDDPIRLLRGTLRRNQRDVTYHLSVYSLCGLTIKAFNAWRDGDTLTELGFSPGGARPERFPVIHRA